MKRVTLTFDNGPWPGVTDHVLRVLDRHVVRATFFMVGQRLQDGASLGLAEEVHAKGHWIGNHTMSHGVPLGLQDASTAEREIGDMDRLLGELAHFDRLFRPNGKGRLGKHLLSPGAVAFLAESKHTIVLWTHVPLDRGVPAEAWVDDAKRAFSDCDWPLLVLHDRPSGHDIPAGSMAYLDQFLTWAKESEIEIVQQFPDSCVPMRNGEILVPMTELITSTTANLVEPQQ